MNPNDIFNMAASIGRAQVAAAQAAHDARQPEVDRLKAINAQMLAALRHVLEYGDLIGVDKEMISAAIARATGKEG